MFNKAQLAERGKHYFDDPKVKKMYATTDGNFFYEDGKNFADSHAKGLKTPVIEITRGDLKAKPATDPNKPKVEKEPSSENGLSFEDLKAKAKELNIKGWAIMKESTLKKKIEEANGTA